MNHALHLAMPWARQCDLYSAPGSLVLKLALGEDPAEIPSSADVRTGASRAAEKTRHGALDRILRRHAGGVNIVRVHAAASSLGRPGAGHRRFDDIEVATGLSRTLRVEMEPGVSVADMVDALRQLEVVEYVTPRYLCALPFAAPAPPSALDMERAWGPRRQISAPEAMAYEAGDPAVILAVVDTGVMRENAEFRNRLRSGFDTVEIGVRELASGVQLVGDESVADTDPADEVGHGTSCAGIIGAAGAQMPPGLAGVCPLLPIRVLGSARVPGKEDPVGVGAISDIDAGVKRAIDMGAKVLNMSFGTPEGSLDPHDPRPHEDVVQYGLARGCVMVAASGNSGKAERFVPACLDGVIAVGAVGPAGQVSPFTTTGEHVALSAPGEQVMSCGIHGYQLVTGTSFAAPFVAAAAALLVSRALKRSSTLSCQDVKRILRESASPWAASQGKGAGGGVLNVIAALRQLDREIDGAAAA
ncbi:MAG TPA: S8 family serine peptidase [Pyrinomonadaceae bacterium]|nr:S8 family serine peptidase [Pyrinomonadaceae bacterium]